MTYTVWMQGKQIGHTRFEYKHTGRKRAGMFVPTEFGLTVLPRITDMCPALMDFGELCSEAGINMHDARADTASAALDAFTDTIEGRRVLGAAKVISEIEVLDPLGQALSWESLAITDVDDLLAMARARTPGRFDDTLAARGPARFTISLTLVKGARAQRPRFGVGESLVEC
jgi:hypothetical protein